MTTLSGKASSGKSWFALGVAVNSAIDGWDVHYLAAEAHDVIGRRLKLAMGDAVPERFTLHSVEPGVTPADMIAEIRDWVVSTRTLLVIDSISTLLGLMRVGSSIDKWDAQDSLEMFLMRVRALTRGEVGILNISEANAQGESKGRVIDHRSDVSVNFVSVEDSDAKEIRVVKAWEGQTGMIGRARIDWKGPGMDLVHEGASGYIEDGETF
jgi:predicted ATP-dependent serine protease